MKSLDPRNHESLGLTGQQKTNRKVVAEDGGCRVRIKMQ